MSRWIKRIGIVLGTVVGLVLVLGGFIWFKASSALSKTYAFTSETVAIPTDSASIARGEHLAVSIAKCVECHGENMGGTVFIDDPGLGKLIAPNLTKGTNGLGSQLSDAQMETAIRHGIGPNGQSLLVMPADDYQFMSDQDLGAVIAYVRSRPPVNSTLPATDLHPLFHMLLGAGQLPVNVAANVDQVRAHPATIAMDTSLAYGHYLVDVGGCSGCHGRTLSGGPIPGVPPGTPPAANLTPSGISRYTDAQVATILRTGKRPDGSSVNDFMPWKRTTLMTDDEINTTIKYLRTVKPKDFGGR